VSDHLTVGAGAMVGSRSAVMASAPAGARLLGYPAETATDWKRGIATVRRLARRGRKPERTDE
jgi:UDP-3-O-[3-hydroxymyristoyl] glucosamine N-acyltransferase